MRVAEILKRVDILLGGVKETKIDIQKNNLMLMRESDGSFWFPPSDEGSESLFEATPPNPGGCLPPCMSRPNKTGHLTRHTAVYRVITVCHLVSILCTAGYLSYA